MKILHVTVIVTGICALMYPLNFWLSHEVIVIAQESNESSMSTAPVNATLSIPGQKEFYLFSVEIPEVDEETLGIPGDAIHVYFFSRKL